MSDRRHDHVQGDEFVDVLGAADVDIGMDAAGQMRDADAGTGSDMLAATLVNAGYRAKPRFSDHRPGYRSWCGLDRMQDRGVISTTEEFADLHR